MAGKVAQKEVKKVVVLLGSPRKKGNSAILAAQIAKGAKAAGAWVIASPVYWFTMSAQTKIFMDRCFALPAYVKNPFAGKRIAIAMSYGDADPFGSGCVNALRTFQDAFNYTGAKIVGMVYGSAYGAGEIRANDVLMKAAGELGKELVCPSP